MPQAILSVLSRDECTPQARNWARKSAVHLLSTLAYAETCAVLSRLFREGGLAVDPLVTLMKTLDTGLWRRVNIQPGWDEIKEVSLSSELCGADLWHLIRQPWLSKGISLG